MQQITTHSAPQRLARRLAVGAVRAWQPSPTVATLAILGTATTYASTSIFVRRLTEAGMSVTAVAFFRFALSAVVLGRFLAVRPDARRATAWGLASGVLMGGGWIVYVNTIETADIAVAGVVQMTAPLFALLVGWLLFDVDPTRRSLLSAALVVTAALVGLGVGPGATAGFSPLLFIAPATFGFSVSVLTERLAPLDPFERLASVAVGAAVAMIPALVASPAAEIIPATPGIAVWVVAIGLLSALLPMTIYAAAAPVIGTARTAAAGAAELPTMFLIGSVFFGERITPGHLAAVVFIASAIALTRSGRSAHVLTDRDGDAVVQ